MNVDIYKAGHHGSHSSSSTAFMSDLHPSVIIISNASDGIKSCSEFEFEVAVMSSFPQQATEA
jgi:hypothetical protein